MTDQILYGIAVVPAIVGLVQVAKEMGLPAHLAPGLAILLGLLAGIAEVFGADWQWTQAVVVGVALGLSASGLYSGSGAVLDKLTAGGRTDGTTVHLQDVTPPDTPTTISQLTGTAPPVQIPVVRPSTPPEDAPANAPGQP